MDEQERAFLRPTSFGFVFQFHFLQPKLIILDNFMLPMRALGRLSPAAMRECDLAMASRMDREIVLMDGSIEKVVEAQR
jgi:ABC-type lipoprotein export system ATPase subunit